MVRKQGFTLIELLVMLGILAILIASLLPLIARAAVGDDQQPVCQANLKRLAQAIRLYCEDYDSLLPLAVSADGNTWMDYLDPYTATTREQRMKYDASTPYQCPVALAAHPGFRRLGKGGQGLGCGRQEVQQPVAGPGNTYGVNGYTLPRQVFDDLAGEWTDQDVLPQLRLSRLQYPDKCVAFGDGHWNGTSWEPLMDVNPWAAPEFVHDGGANFAFYDGHVAYFKSSQIPWDRHDPFWRPIGMASLARRAPADADSMDLAFSSLDSRGAIQVSTRTRGNGDTG